MSTIDLDELFLADKYRPRTVEECILPKAMKARFQQFVDAKTIPFLLLYGPPGVGKTTVARAMIDQVDGECLFINASLDGNIDTLRTTIMAFASTVSFDGKKKYVILDEADRLTPAMQEALRGFVQEMAANCVFILTANYANRLIEPLRSRFGQIDFSILAGPKARAAAGEKFYERLVTILDREEIAYKDTIIAKLIEKFAPDWRKVLVEIDSYSQGNRRTIDAGILQQNSAATSFAPLFDAVKKRNFNAIRSWVGENVDTDVQAIFTGLFQNVLELVTSASAPDAVVILAEYQYKSAFVADQQINMTAMLVEIAGNCELNV